MRAWIPKPPAKGREERAAWLNLAGASQFRLMLLSMQAFLFWRLNQG